MSDLFTQLAARTLELMPLVQPRINSLFTPKIAAETIEPAAAFAESATSAPIAQQSWNGIAATPPLVNPYRPTLPIARAPRSVALAIVPSLAGNRVVSSVQSDRTVPDVSPTADQTFLETNSVSPAELTQRSNPASACNPSETFPFAPAPIPTENIVPKASVSPAMNSNELQARSDFEPSQTSERLPFPPGDLLTTELAMENSAHTDSRTGQILVSHEVLRRAPAAAQPTISPQQPLLDRTKINPDGTVSPVVIPRQTDVLLPTVALRTSRSLSRQSEARAASPAPPTIQVTIGRIEVRAVPPSAPPRPRTATPTARLSLEDYLRSRSGGER